MLLGKKLNRRKNKSKSKKQRTFTSSEFSLPDERNQLSLSELFRNDALKRKIPPQPNPPKKIKSQKQLQTTKKRTKSRSKLRLDKCETYEVIPYKNSLNSEIVFSNEETRREGILEERVSEHLAIRVKQQYLVDSNRQLRISIKKEYQKKVDAAIKIQKVFRGYLTRKILQKYVQYEQKFINDKLAQHRSESISEHSSYFNEKETALEHRRKVQVEQAGVFEYSNPRNNEEEDSEEEMDHAIYRHHEPIYSQDEISGYLESSEQEDFDQDAFDNHIIFETNQEYIDSRKSSLQQPQPKNKLSRAGLPLPITEQPPETPTNPPASQELDLSKTEKKQGDRMKMKMQQEQVKDATMKLNDEIDKSPPIHQFLENIEYAATMKEKEGIMKKHSQKYIEIESSNVEKLKEVELHRWEEIIGLVQSQINKTMINNNELTHFMKQIMEISMKNKEMLEVDAPSLSSSNNSALHSENSLSRLSSREKLKNIRANRQYLSHHESHFDHDKDRRIQITNMSMESAKETAYFEPIKSDRKKDNIVLSDRAMFFNQQQRSEQKMEKVEQNSNIPASSLSPISSFDHTGQMKKFLAGNIQDEHIEQMLKLREDLMKKREIDEMRKLNADVEDKKITQQEFLSRLEQISTKYIEQKACIEKAKEDISRGYRAALKLTKQAFNDAKKLGYNLPVSRSVEGIKFKAPLMFNDIIIDEMVHGKKQEMKLEKVQKFQKLQSKEQDERVHIDLGSDEDSSDLEFTEEELKRFRMAKPYDIEFAEQIADLGRNVMISEELLRQQQIEDDQENNLMKTHVFREIYEIEQMAPTTKNNPKAELITQKVFDAIIWELAGQLLVKPLFSERLIDKNHYYKPKIVSDTERLRFIQLLESNFPSVEILNSKLNQKICPLPTELLRCMRIDFSEEDEDDENSYEQIGKYEFIIGQEICNEAIKTFRKEVEGELLTTVPSLADLEELNKQFSMSDKVIKYVQQREKYITNRKNHTRELRWQVLNIQIHCIFDAWNEELIFLRSQKVGYSGIGLNELTLAVKDHNCLIPTEDTIKIINDGKKRLINNLSISSPSIIFPTFVEEDDDQLLDTDSKWIFYADEALSYGLELVYLIEEEIFSEFAKELRKRMLQFY